jgi:hypothetical protein
LFAGEYCHTIPGALTYPDGFVSGGSQSVRWKPTLLCFELLEADNVGLFLFKPAQEICKPLVDVVDVECCDLHAQSAGVMRA